LLARRRADRRQGPRALPDHRHHPAPLRRRRGRARRAGGLAMRLSARQIAHLTDGHATGPTVAFDAFSTDSRKLAPGSLFIALSGERFDGHDFVAAALDAGAAGALVSRDVAAPSDACIIR